MRIRLTRVNILADNKFSFESCERFGAKVKQYVERECRKTHEHLRDHTGINRHVTLRKALEEHKVANNKETMKNSTHDTKMGKRG